MAVVVAGGLQIPLPRMAPVRQIFDAPEVKDVEGAVKAELAREEIRQSVRPGDRVAVGVGSRGIVNLDVVVKTLIQELKNWGAQPFIVPAMGSHGGATGEGQKAVLSQYGITEESMGVPIVGSMDVVLIGTLEDGLPVYLDKEAAGADAIVFVNRVKPHTSFKGDYESGLLKMMAIGLGRHEGAAAAHQRPLSEFPRLLPKMAEVYIRQAPVKFGLALLENAYDKTAKIRAVLAREMIEEEKKLLAEAKQLLPRILPSPIDVLVVSEIGKNISGSGMDPNITGRAASKAPQTFNAPPIERIVVLGLTEETKGNACGIGVADVTTKRVFEKINLDYTYANIITSKVLDSGKIPMMMANDKEALQVALHTCYHADVQHPRIVWIKNTLELEKIWVSEAFLPEVEEHARMELEGEPITLQFDGEGFLTTSLW